MLQGRIQSDQASVHLKNPIRFPIPLSTRYEARPFPLVDVNRHDPTAETPVQSIPSLFKPGTTLREEELILCKTDKGDKTWSLAEVHKIYPYEVEVIYYTTPHKHLDKYKTATHEQRQECLSQTRFRKTWFIRTGTNAGKGMLNPPFPRNPLLRL
jgi:hypothetical protein